MTYKCKFCNAILCTEWSLQNHQKRTKKCLDKQGIVPKGEFKCNICNELFLYKIVQTTHSITCSKKRINIELESKYNDLQLRYNELESKYNIIESTHNTIIEDKKILEVRYDNLFDKITTSALSKTSNNTDIEECQTNISRQISEIIELKLTLKNNTILNIPVSRDGYVNCTKLCQAGNKRIDNWIANKQSKELLDAYSKLPGILGTGIKRVIDGGNVSLKNQGTYYPIDIAIQIAQWCNPYFALQVSRWTRELTIYNIQLKENLKILESKSLYISNNILDSQKNNTEIILCKLSFDNKNFVHIPVQKDGMVNATSLCKAGNKLFGDYKRNKQTDEYLHALSAVMGIPITALINI